MTWFTSAVLVCLLLAGCADSQRLVPGEGGSATPCDQIIDGCSAQRLENIVLRDGATTDGAFLPIDGLDTGGVIGFDDALESAWTNDYQGEAETVQVVLGAADADELRWGTGTNLYYAVKWGGVCPFISDPPLSSPPPAPNCDATHTTVLDARTGEFIVSGE